MSNANIEIPLGLRSAIESGECALFLGAGIGRYALDATGQPAPDGTSLAKAMAEHFGINPGPTPDLAKVSEIVQIRKGRGELEAYIASRLNKLEPDDNFRWLCGIRWKAIFTTNYDSTIERAYELTSAPPQSPVSIGCVSGLIDYDPRFQVPIYYLHGHLMSSSHPRILITQADYARFRERRRMLFEQLKRQLAVSNIVYIGYSNKDPNWHMILEEVRSEFAPSDIPRGYRISPSDDPLDVEILAFNGIETLAYDFHTFVNAASQIISPSRISEDKLTRLRKSVPLAFATTFEKNPAPVVRLLESWDYVNAAKFGDPPNTSTFLRGEKANWSLIAARKHFERDIEQDIYDDLLDFITSTSSLCRASLVLGPAGYGISTLLMSLAARLVAESDIPVLMLKPGRPLREGDVEFACASTGKRPIFFVDDAARYHNQIRQSLSCLRELRQSAAFVLGARQNEWGLIPRPPTVTPFQLQPLSDPEICRLLDCLAANGELNRLAPLTRDQQISAIREKHKKELLVAMREATEGVSFDAILEDEYSRLPTLTTKRAYLITCCFHQYGVWLRADLLAKLLDLEIIRMYDEVGKATEGVIRFEETDSALGQYSAQARHRVIAGIVWKRCATESERQDIVQSSIAAINLTFRSDREAFDYFYRDDNLVDDLSSLERRTRFFDVACHKDPTNAYVRQHYARMLYRANKIELALQMIDDALRIDNSLRVLHHTKGTILTGLALHSDNDDIARRFLARSEDSFRHTIRLQKRDSYGYCGLAQLYIGWARRISNIEERSLYIAKAEEVIQDGLNNASSRDSLWVEASKIEEYVGAIPACIDALEQAIRENPEGIVARYLLAGAYLTQDRPDAALSIMEPVINKHHGEYRTFIRYGLALLRVGRTYSEAIAIMNLALPDGYRDSRFIATLGGMYFMNQEFTEAARVFSERHKRDFSAQELERPYFHPRELGTQTRPVQLSGTVLNVKPGYSFIASAGFGQFLCPASKYEGLILRQKMEIYFQPAFCAKGALALHPTLK